MNWFANPQKCDILSEEIKKIIVSPKVDALRFYLLKDNAKVQGLKGVSLAKIKEFLHNDK